MAEEIRQQIISLRCYGNYRQFLSIFRKSVLNVLAKSPELPLPILRGSENFCMLSIHTHVSNCLPHTSKPTCPKFNLFSPFSTTNLLILTFFLIHLFKLGSSGIHRLPLPLPSLSFPVHHQIITILPSLYISGPHTVSISKASINLIGSHLNSNYSFLTNSINGKELKPQGITLFSHLKIFLQEGAK